MPATRLAIAIVTGLVIFAQPMRAADKTLRQVIDADIRAAWQREKVTPAPRCDDAAFLRRIYLDLVGCIPSYEETTQFLTQTNPEKRSQLVERLLADPRFASHQADVWSLVLFGRRPALDQSIKREPFKKWLTAQFAENKPYDQLVRELLLAEQDGTELYYLQYRNQPEEATVAVTRHFLGTQLQCARCHDHPYENWTQRDFYGMAGFFVRLVAVDGMGKNARIAEKSTGEVLFSGSVKDLKPGQKGEPVKAKFLDGTELAEPPLPKDFKEADFKSKKGSVPKPIFSRKEKLAAWVTAPDNPYFARALANRVWAQLLGRGLVHPVDDLSDKKTPSHPELLQALARHVRATKFDLKGLIREIVNSDTYQLAGTGANADAYSAWFERAAVRPLSAEELLASWKVATSYPADAFKAVDPTAYMMRYFGEPNDGQGHFQGSLAEHLFQNNSPHIRGMAQQRKGNLTDTLLTTKGSWDEKVDRLFVSVLSRPPSAVERQRFVKHLSSNPQAAPALVEEAVWALLSCSEFRFNH
jgi:hypothetical protein